MSNIIYIGKKIPPYNKTIEVSSDKSLSIRTILLASQAMGIYKISNLLQSDDILNTLKTIKKLLNSSLTLLKLTTTWVTRSRNWAG